MAPFSITLFMFSFLFSNDATITIFLWEISRDHFSLIMIQTLEFNGAKKFNMPIFFQSKCWLSKSNETNLTRQIIFIVFLLFYLKFHFKYLKRLKL